MVSMRNKKKYPSIIIEFPYLELCFQMHPCIVNTKKSIIMTITLIVLSAEYLAPLYECTGGAIALPPVSALALAAAT